MNIPKSSNIFFETKQIEIKHIVIGLWGLTLGTPYENLSILAMECSWNIRTFHFYFLDHASPALLGTVHPFLGNSFVPRTARSEHSGRKVEYSVMKNSYTQLMYGAVTIHLGSNANRINCGIIFNYLLI